MLHYLLKLTSIKTQQWNIFLVYFALAAINNKKYNTELTFSSPSYQSSLNTLKRFIVIFLLWTNNL